MIIKIIVVVLLAALILSKMTLAEYEQFQKQNPQNLLQQLDLEEEEYFPEVSKLMFLTPWNGEGSGLTVKYAYKIDYVSPCWYTLQINNKESPAFENQYNYDPQFVHHLKLVNPEVKLVPRVYVDGGSINFFQTVGSDRVKFNQAIQLVSRIVKEKNFDGLVWDTPYNFYEKSRSSLNQLINQFIKAIRVQIGTEKMIFFNMANPMDHMNTLEVQLYKQLPVNYILIQNYDKENNYIEMVRKSIQWSQQIEGIKTMLLLPFFTVKVGVGSLSTQEAVRSLKRMGVANSKVQNGICSFSQAKSQRKYLIPCLTYFKQIFSLASQANVGVGFWEGGNGLQNYYKFL